MRPITQIFIHCSDTYPRMDIGVKEIRKWHVEERKWSDIGYHDVIRRNGGIETGRPLEKPGAHVKGHNQNSIGICLVGGKAEDGSPEFNFTKAQMHAVSALVKLYRERFPQAEVLGHNDVSTKSCPCFDVTEYFKDA